MSPVKQASAPETPLISTILASVSHTIAKIEIKSSPKNALDPHVGDYITAIINDVALLTDVASTFNERQQTMLLILQRGSAKFAFLYNNNRAVFDDFTFEAYGVLLEMRRYLKGLKGYKSLLPLDQEFINSYSRRLSPDEVTWWLEHLGSVTDRQLELITQIGSNVELMTTAFEVWEQDKESLMYSVMPYFQVDMQPLAASVSTNAHKNTCQYIQAMVQYVSSIAAQIDSYRLSKCLIRPLTRDEMRREFQTLLAIRLEASRIPVKYEIMKLNPIQFPVTDEQITYLERLMKTVHIFGDLMDDLSGMVKTTLCLDTLE